MVMQMVSANSSRRQQIKRRGWFRCCVAAADTISLNSDAEYDQVHKGTVYRHDDNSTSQQCTDLHWKQLQQQQEDQQSTAIRTLTVSSSITPSDSSNDAAAAAALGLLQHTRITANALDSMPQPPAAAAAAAAAAAGGGGAAVPVIARASASTAATCGSAVPSRTATPVTDLAVLWAAGKTAAAASGTAAADMHSSLTAGVQQQQQKSSKGDAAAAPPKDYATCSSNTQQQQQQQSGTANSSSLSSGVRLLDVLSGSRSASSSCHATASSDGATCSSRSSSTADLVAAASVTVQHAGDGEPAGVDSGHARQIAQSRTCAADLVVGTTETRTATPIAELESSNNNELMMALEAATTLQREISLSPVQPAAPPTPPPTADNSLADASSSIGSSNLGPPPAATQNKGSIAVGEAAAVKAASSGTVVQDQAGSGFRFSSSGSFPVAAMASAESSSSASRAAAAAASPFAQLALQKTVSETLRSSTQQQQQQQGRSVTAAAAVPASLASFSTAAAAAAAGTRVSSSSGPAVFGRVATRTSRISWATSSTVLGGDPSEVFDILDPETSSTTNVHTILRKSASATSMSGLAAASSSSSSNIGAKTARDKFKQLRGAMSFGGSGRSKAAAAATGGGDSADADQPGSGGSSSSSRFKSVWRRSTECQPVNPSLTKPDNPPAARRSKSAYTNILAQQQQQLRQQQLSDPGQRLPPPYPTAAASVAAAASPKGSSSSLSSSGRLASGEARSSSSSLDLGATNSRTGSPGLAVRDMSRLSLGSELKTAGSSSGSLVGLAVTRMHTSRSAPLLMSNTATTSSSSGSSSGSGGQLSSMGSVSSTASSSTAAAAAAAGSGKAGPSKGSSIQVANAFAEAFLAALATGNTKWGSAAAVAQLIDNSAKMLGMDKQLYVGKTAIIRRLNSGMDQLVKMVGAYADNSSSSSSSANAASKGSESNVMSDLADQLPKPLLTVTCPDPRAKPSSVVAVYTFKWGIRKFTLQDEFIVKNGQIVRLRRSRS